MNLKILIAALLVAAPATARADLVYKCKSVKFSDQLSADLRLSENGKSGRLELSYWNGYPPLGLVYADLKADGTKGGAKAYASAVDAHTGYTAEVLVPADFKNLDDFVATIRMNDKKRVRSNDLLCNRF